MTEQLAVNKEVSTGPLMHSKVLALCDFQGSKYSDTDRIGAALLYLVSDVSAYGTELVLV